MPKVTVDLTEARNDQKLAELILYIAARSEGDPRCGAVKLNKLLFFADFLAYLNFGKPITGQEYQHLENGPAPRRMLPVLEQLKTSGGLAEGTTTYYGRAQRRFHALRDSKLNLFTAEEIDLIDRLVAEFWDKNATEMSETSHGFVGWQVTEIGETIPYPLALIGRRPLTAREIERGAELEARARQVLAANAG